MKSKAPTPAPAMSPADASAHDKASYVRPFLSPVGEQALARLEAGVAGWFPNGGDKEPAPEPDKDALLRVRESSSALRAGLAEYRNWARSAA